MEAQCSIDGCEKPAYCRGWCGTHYARWYAHGEAWETPPPRKRADVAERFWTKVDQTGECWIWTASLDRKGYGQFMLQAGKLVRAHRLAWELTLGPIPGDLTLDHLCRNRACVNPDHLQPVTNRENILRGEAPSAQQARMTHCLKGHPLTGANLIWDSGHRRCRICRNLNQNERNRRKRQAG